jgi:hypothetical protein
MAETAKCRRKASCGFRVFEKMIQHKIASFWYYSWHDFQPQKHEKKLMQK